MVTFSAPALSGPSSSATPSATPSAVSQALVNTMIPVVFVKVAVQILSPVKRQKRRFFAPIRGFGHGLPGGSAFFVFLNFDIFSWMRRRPSGQDTRAHWVPES